MNKTVIVNENFTEHELMGHLNLTKTVTTLTIIPDLIPSMGLICCARDAMDPSMITRLNKMQKIFKNAFAVVVGICDATVWNDLQMSLLGGTLRLFQVEDMAEAATLVARCYKEMSQKERFDRQSLYFKGESERLVGSDASISIIRGTFRRLHLSDNDAQIIMDGFPSMRQIINAPKELLFENSPASTEAIESVSSFFKT
ncbi:hypothetical protein B484DRAFT_393794 [Ochromonadaceae sp. CCMP2298]|nr:hypothetical protein B484DRAFT_393794 [Ochromonadaceae sp. CCMP2298]